jgi:Tol biopolymer transport system component
MLGRGASVPEQIGQSLLQSDTYANSVAFSRDGSKLAAGFGDGTVQIWNLGRGQPLTRSGTRQNNGVLALAFSPDPEGKMIATAGQEVILLDGRTGQATGPSLDGQQGWMTSISFHPDGSILASSSSGTLILWDLETGKALAPLPEAREIHTVAFSPDGKVLAAGSADGYLQLWNLEKKGLIADLDTNGDAIFSIAFSPDGKSVAAGNADSTIFLRDVEFGQQAGPPLDRHTGIVNQVAFSPDGTMLASGSMDGTILLWDVQTGQAVGQPLDADSSGVYSIAFSPDGKTLASASGNFDHSRIMLWDVDITSWLQKTCRRAGRNFTASEWERFFPGEPYRKTCAEFQKDPVYYQARAEDLLLAQDKPLDLQKAIEDLKAEMKLDTAIEQPSWKARQIITQIVGNQITDEAYNGSFLKALDLMDQAQENDLALDPQLMDASLFNRLCWEGSVSGAVRQVMEYCEQAVALAPEDSDVRDSRGLARALMKDTSGAMKDFQFFIENSEEVDLIQQRQAWMDELKAGRNPFTPGVLEQLKD